MSVSPPRPPGSKEQTPAPRRPFVPDDESDGDNFHGLVTTVRRAPVRRLVGEAPRLGGGGEEEEEEEEAGPTNQRNKRSNARSASFLPSANSSLQHAAGAAAAVAPLTDESPAPKAPRHELHAAAAGIAPVAPPQLAETAEYDADLDDGTALLRTVRRVPAVHPVQRAVVTVAAGEGATVMKSARGAPVITPGVTQHDDPVPTATPANPGSRGIWVGEPLTATQEALDVVDGYVPPSPPPFFAAPSVSAPRPADDAHAAEAWRAAARDYFAFIDKQPLHVADKVGDARTATA